VAAPTRIPWPSSHLQLSQLHLCPAPWPVQCQPTRAGPLRWPPRGPRPIWPSCWPSLLQQHSLRAALSGGAPAAAAVEAAAAMNGTSRASAERWTAHGSPFGRQVQPKELRWRTLWACRMCARGSMHLANRCLPRRLFVCCLPLTHARQQMLICCPLVGLLLLSPAASDCFTLRLTQIRRATTSSTGSTRKVGRHSAAAAAAAAADLGCLLPRRSGAPLPVAHSALSLCCASAHYNPAGDTQGAAALSNCIHLCSAVGGHKCERCALRCGGEAGGAGEDML